MGVIKGDTRSLDYTQHPQLLTEHNHEGVAGVHRWGRVRNLHDDSSKLAS